MNQKRNPYYAMVRMLEEKGEREKAEKIRLNMETFHPLGI